MTESEQLDFWTQLLRLDGFRVAHVRRDTPTDPCAHSGWCYHSPCPAPGMRAQALITV